MKNLSKKLFSSLFTSTLLLSPLASFSGEISTNTTDLGFSLQKILQFKELAQLITHLGYINYLQMEVLLDYNQMFFQKIVLPLFPQVNLLLMNARGKFIF